MDRKRLGGEPPAGEPLLGRRTDPGRVASALRGLVGAGRSRISPTTAARARDVSRPTDEDLAWAEETVVLRHAYPWPTAPDRGSDRAHDRAERTPATDDADQPRRGWITRPGRDRGTRSPQDAGETGEGSGSSPVRS